MQTFKQHILESHTKEQLTDIMNHGCISGSSNYIYYHETSDAYNKHAKEIWDRLFDVYEDLGYQSPLEMISSFNGSKQVTSDETFKNLLVWWYVEEISIDYIENLEADWIEEKR